MYRHYQQYNLRCSLDQLQIFKPLAPSIMYVPIVIHRDALNAEVRYRLRPLIAFLMQLSFDLQFPAHHARNLIPFRLIKANEMHYFSTFGKELYMFQTDLLAIIRSLNTVYTATGICHTSCVDFLVSEVGTSCHTSCVDFLASEVGTSCHTSCVDFLASEAGTSLARQY